MTFAGSAAAPALHVFGPALERGVYEALHQILFLIRHFFRDIDGRLIVVEACVGQQVDYRIYARLHDGVGLVGQKSLLRNVLVRQERRHVERVGAYLIVGVPEFHAQERPIAGASGSSDEDRLALELGERVVTHVRMRDEDLRVFLEDRRDTQERQVLLDVVEPLEGARHDHVDTAAEQHLRGVLLRTAHAQVAVDAVFLVDAIGNGEIEAAVLGLGAPVGLIADLVERLGMHARARNGDE